MKPGEDMHAAVEEVDLDPCELYVELGTLIVEGRVPGLTDRGFGEGPHCPIPHGQNRHQCDPSRTECQKYEQIEKHMLLLWKNGIPMSIEVLLYPDCCTPSQNVDTVPEMSYILLEQWTIHMLPRRVPDASISPRGLIQAVRSFLYFSQLCAWLSLTGGKSPQNVHYRVCVPGEAFSSKFSTQPDCHIFPIANVGRNAAMKVLMKCHPRCGEIPVVSCFKHSKPNLPLKVLKCRTKETEASGYQATGEYVYDGILPTGLPTSRTSSPADSMLGESLLDPPNNLCMFPKRYQSPSRCGSPSIEVPEHLMFGKSLALKREDSSPPRRSRPQRRPVVERFLKKTLGDDSSTHSLSENRCRTYDKRSTVMKEALKSSQNISCLKKDEALSYCCINDDFKMLPKAEMEEVLERLRERQSGIKGSSGDTKPDVNKSYSLSTLPLSAYLEDVKIAADATEHKNENKNPFLKGNPPFKSRTVLKQSLQLDNESYKYKNSQRKSSADNLLSPGFQASLSQPHNAKWEKVKNQLTSRNFNNLQTLGYSEYHKNENNLFYNLKEEPSGAILTRSQKFDHPYLNTYHDKLVSSHSNIQMSSKHSTVNIKKYGDVSNERTTDEDLSDEREILKSPDVETLDAFIEDGIYSHVIPSAEEKALFRRSLDSATNLVFHQKSGLPLTSSPAPIRKSGTCFDFDSSLTSVSAIKRALFEKDAEEEKTDEEKLIQLSNSAPASTISSSLLGTFEESVLNGRLEPVSTVEGFTAEIGASGSFCPRHITLPVTVFFYTLHDMDKVTSPYMGHINLRNKDYHIPKKGTVQVTLFNPHNTVVKMFVVRYDLCDMPVNCQTFLRQRTLYMPSNASESDQDAQKWLRYLIHLRFVSSKSGRIYLHTDIRVIIFRKSDLDAATVLGQRPYELRSFTHGPLNPKFSPHKP